MPWEQRWVDAPKNLSLTVFPELPEGAWELTALPMGRHRLALGDGKKYSHCWHCGGWVEGFYYEAQENTLAPLSGRCGTAAYCPRCGQEVEFHGMVS